MNEKRFISMHDTQDAALGKIEELRAKGYEDSHIYVVTKHEDNVSILRRDTDVHTEAAHHASWFDKVRAFLSGHEDVHAGLRNMGLSEEEVKRHYDDVEAGKILVYVDEDFERRHQDGVTVDAKPYQDASSTHLGNHTDDGLEIDSKPYHEAQTVDPSHPVDPEQDKLDEETKKPDREEKLRGLDDRAYRNDVEDPDNIRRF
ncbi:general stress protein [Exiguobacterium sp. CH10]|uniref:general stress protein n=1 Tax=Exiguobacterium sp. CH10 TaxID=2751261 RepID=UPI001BECCACD|nr:general stress protein [Exiguobacterium sp. CH10]